MTGDGGLNAEADARNGQDEGKHHHVRSAVDDIDGRGHHHIQSTDHSPEEQRIYVRRHSAHAHEAEGAPPAADDKRRSKSLPFGKPGEPVDIASNRLDIDDVEKTALYTGEVVATQAGATMTSPEMTVTYEGAVAPEATAAVKIPAEPT